MHGKNSLLRVGLDSLSVGPTSTGEVGRVTSQGESTLVDCWS